MPNPIPANLYFVRVFQPGYGPKIVTALMSDLDPIAPAGSSDLRGQNILFPLTGAPSASTLPAGNYSAAIAGSGYLAGDVAGQGSSLWICTAPGSNASSTWQQVTGGSGGGGLQQFKIVADAGDYWLAKTWDGMTLGTISQSVIKPYKLRAGANKIAAETIRGTTYNYTYAASGGIYSRTVAGSDGTAESDYILPDPLVNDVIYALPCSTPVFAASQIPYPVVSASVAAAGTGYTTGDVLTCSVATGSGGGVSGVACQLTITAAAGKITGATISNAGLYFLAIANPAAFTGGTGSGGTFNLTLQSPLVDINADGRAWGAQ